MTPQGGRVTPVHPFERLARRVRQVVGPHRAEALWSVLRPIYDALALRLYRRGIEWSINGTDRIRLLPRFRTISENHETDAWHAILGALRPGDVVADVGASTGLYSIAMANRIGPTGKVLAFEPDPKNFAILQGHIRLNEVESRVEAVRAAVGAAASDLYFQVGKGAFSHVTAEPREDSVQVPCVCLDDALAGRRVDLLKIDVEGYEEEVLRGARSLLSDPARRPRFVYLEVHPWAWARAGLTTTRESVDALLRECGYDVQALDGRPALDAGEAIDWMAVPAVLASPLEARAGAQPGRVL